MIYYTCTAPLIPDNCTDGEIRLRGGSSEREGRVEICIDQIWGTICDTAWDSQDSDVVCKQLGFPSLGVMFRLLARVVASLVLHCVVFHA